VGLARPFAPGPPFSIDKSLEMAVFVGVDEELSKRQLFTKV
jgi:hypothetical protein